MSAQELWQWVHYSYGDELGMYVSHAARYLQPGVQKFKIHRCSGPRLLLVTSAPCFPPYASRARSLWWHVPFDDVTYIISTCHPQLRMPYIRTWNWGLGSRRIIDSRFGSGYHYTPPLGSPSLWVSIVFYVICYLWLVHVQVSLGF